MESRNVVVCDNGTGVRPSLILDPFPRSAFVLVLVLGRFLGNSLRNPAASDAD